MHVQYRQLCGYDGLMMPCSCFGAVNTVLLGRNIGFVLPEICLV